MTAFTITSTSCIPVWGQLADVFGRHAVLQIVMVIMMVGAALPAGAQSWIMLLFGRALMGVAAAGILNIIKIVLADGVSLKENAKNNTIFFLLRKDLIGPAPCETRGRLGTCLTKMSTIDYGGLFLFVSGITPIILGTTWGGATYAWNSVAVIVSIAVGSGMLLAFFLYEYLMEPEAISVTTAHDTASAFHARKISRFWLGSHSPRAQPCTPFSISSGSISPW